MPKNVVKSPKQIPMCLVLYMLLTKRPSCVHLTWMFFLLVESCWKWQECVRAPWVCSGAADPLVMGEVSDLGCLQMSEHRTVCHEAAPENGDSSVSTHE